MKYNFVFNEDDRPVVVAIEKFPQENGVLVEVPESFDVMHPNDWKYDGEAWIYDPLPKVEYGEDVPTLESRVKTLEEESTEMSEALEMILLGVTE